MASKQAAQIIPALAFAGVAAFGITFAGQCHQCLEPLRGATRIVWLTRYVYTQRFATAVRAVESMSKPSEQHLLVRAKSEAAETARIQRRLTKQHSSGAYVPKAYHNDEK